MDLEAKLIKNEQTLLLSYTRDSRTKLQELLSNDFFEIGQSGKVYNLNEVIESLSKEDDRKIEISNIEFRMLDDTMAQLIYTARTYVQNNNYTLSKRSSIWRNEAGMWKIIFHQGTKIV